MQSLLATMICSFLAGLCVMAPYMFGKSRLSPASNLSSGSTSAADYVKAPLCKASGYCSLEAQRSHYVGPLRSNLELKAALKALAFRKEIILTTESRTDPAAQFVSNYQKAGYGHVLVMTNEPKLCTHLSTLFKKLGCGWCPEPTLYDDTLSSMFDLYSQYPKLWMGARIIRQGYNVMVVDSDTMLFYDFYLHVKQPPLAEIQFIANWEGNNSMNVNGGWFYVQNASPSGPIAWIFAEATVRFARMVMQPAGLHNLTHAEGYCNDQAAMHDALYSAVIGRPYINACVKPYEEHKLHNVWHSTWQALIQHAAGSGSLSTILPAKICAVSNINKDIVQNPDYELFYATLKLPHVFGATAKALGIPGWPAALGGKIFGNESIHPSIVKMVQEFLIKNVDAPLWPDLEDPLTAVSADSHPNESFAFVPWWLVNTFHQGGRFGTWNSKLTNISMAVIGHVWAGFPPGRMQKRAFLSCSNLLDYNLAKRIHKHDTCIYPGCLHGSDTKFSVLAYSPTMFNHTTTPSQFGSAVTDLGRLAVAMKRIIGWPGAPLSANWTQNALLKGEVWEGYGVGGKPHVIPWTYVNWQLFMAFSPNDLLAELSGVWTPMFCEGGMVWAKV